MQPWHRSGERFVTRVDRTEAALLRQLFEELLVVLGSNDRTDDVVARLFPPPHIDDPAVAADVRGLIEDDLRSGKQAAARAALEALPAEGRLELDSEVAEQWLTALNDVRLAVGTRLGLRDDNDPVPPTDLGEIYHWLGYQMETLVDALAGWD